MLGERGEEVFGRYLRKRIGDFFDDDKMKHRIVARDDVHVRSRLYILKLFKRRKDMRIENGRAFLPRLGAVFVPTNAVGSAAGHVYFTLRIDPHALYGSIEPDRRDNEPSWIRYSFCLPTLRERSVGRNSLLSRRQRLSKGKRRKRVHDLCIGEDDWRERGRRDSNREEKNVYARDEKYLYHESERSVISLEIRVHIFFHENRISQ